MRCARSTLFLVLRGSPHSSALINSALGASTLANRFHALSEVPTGSSMMHESEWRGWLGPVPCMACGRHERQRGGSVLA